MAIVVFTNDGLQIQVSQDIAIENNGRFANQFLRELVRSGGAHRLQLDHVFKLYTKFGTVAELLFNLLRLVRKRERNVGGAGAAEGIDLIKQERRIAAGYNGLSSV